MFRNHLIGQGKVRSCHNEEVIYKPHFQVKVYSSITIENLPGDVHNKRLKRNFLTVKNKTSSSNSTQTLNNGSHLIDQVSLISSPRVTQPILSNQSINNCKTSSTQGSVIDLDDSDTSAVFGGSLNLKTKAVTREVSSNIADEVGLLREAK
ncbi:Uncharacterized protein Rs2_18256 [Raphanus sativus]|nr:Uncharacterized protein Rs2_18256 [Raphanus sativus]